MNKNNNEDDFGQKKSKEKNIDDRESLKINEKKERNNEAIIREAINELDESTNHLNKESDGAIPGDCNAQNLINNTEERSEEGEEDFQIIPVSGSINLSEQVQFLPPDHSENVNLIQKDQLPKTKLEKIHYRINEYFEALHQFLMLDKNAAKDKVLAILGITDQNLLKHHIDIVTFSKLA